MARAERTVETDSERTCIVTRQIHAPSEMLRFVLGPDETVVPDLKRNLPGRGVWVSAEAKIVAEAVKRQLFAKGFKTKARASETLSEEVDRLMEQQALQSLSIANKAGLVTSGAAKVEKIIGAGPVAGMVHAIDGGSDGIRKMGQVLMRTYGPVSARIPRIILFASGQLDLALGRSNVIHAALKRGAASDVFLERCRRLTHYRHGAEAKADSELTEFSGPEAMSAPVQAGADDRNQRGGGPEHCHEDRPEPGSGAHEDRSEPGSDDNVMTSGHGPGIETI